MKFRFKANFHLLALSSLAGTVNIPPRHHKRSTANVQLGTRSHTRTSKNQASASPAQQKKKRNTSRVQRAKVYFRQKRIEHRNNNDTAGGTAAVEANFEMMEIEEIADSPAISVSSEDTVTSN